LVVTNQIAHQHIDDVIINGNRLFEARHKGRIKEEV
jgi:hypothetical protein